MKKNTPEDGTHNIDKKNHLAAGAFIRKFKIDEFPQLINIIKGELNLLGPRPGLVSQQKLTEARSEKNIYSVKPGITGLAQSTGFDMSNPSKLAKVDEIFIQNKSLKVMTLIFMATFFKTPRKILIKKFKLNNI